MTRLIHRHSFPSEPEDERSPLTLEQIERREFTYCSAYYTDPWVSHKFIVGTPSKPEAQRRAEAFATERWGPPNKVLVYPRTYVKEARACFAEGDYEGGTPPTPSTEPLSPPGQLDFTL